MPQLELQLQLHFTTDATTLLGRTDCDSPRSPDAAAAANPHAGGSEQLAFQSLSKRLALAASPAAEGAKLPVLVLRVRGAVMLLVTVECTSGLLCLHPGASDINGSGIATVCSLFTVLLVFLSGSARWCKLSGMICRYQLGICII